MILKWEKYYFYYKLLHFLKLRSETWLEKFNEAFLKGKVCEWCFIVIFVPVEDTVLHTFTSWFIVRTLYWHAIRFCDADEYAGLT